MTDVDGLEVNVGDVVKVLFIRDNIKEILADDEKPHVLAMLGNDYEIEEFVNEDSQISLSVWSQESRGCMYCGLYLFPNEFRLVRRKANLSSNQ